MPGGQETFKEYGAPFGSGDEIGVFVDLASSPGAASGCTRISLPSSGWDVIVCDGSCAHVEESMSVVRLNIYVYVHIMHTHPRLFQWL